MPQCDISLLLAFQESFQSPELNHIYSVRLEGGSSSSKKKWARLGNKNPYDISQRPSWRCSSKATPFWRQRQKAAKKSPLKSQTVNPRYFQGSGFDTNQRKIWNSIFLLNMFEFFRLFNRKNPNSGQIGFFDNALA